MKTIHQQCADGWDFLWNRLFDENSCMIYDYITSYDPEKQFDHLPVAEEIETLLPNPSGWGTGMEDCMLNAGVAMDAVCREFERTGDEIWRIRARKLFHGMERCASVHGKRGFVVRGVARDGIHCYINSSRDQFTLFVYGVWRFLGSPLSPADEKQRARELLCAVADYCEKTMTDANDFNLLRLDGRKAMVSRLAGTVQTHEIMRLPMFYAAAWQASGNPRYYERYRKHALNGIEENLKIDRERHWWEIELSQMQFSLRLLYEVEPDPVLRGKYLETMRIVRSLAEAALEREKKKQADYSGDFSALNGNWRYGTFKLREEIPGLFRTSAVWEGNGYFMPIFPNEYKTGAELLRAFGNLATTIFLVPAALPPERTVELLTNFLQKPDFRHCASSAVVNLLEAALLIRRTSRPLCSFALVGDVQYADRDGGNGRDFRGGLSRLRELISRLNRRNLDFIVSLGDLGDGQSRAEIPAVLECYRESVHPVRYVVGNHAFVCHNEDELRKLFGEKDFFYDFSIGKIRFIVLNGLDESRFSPPGSLRRQHYEQYKKEHPERVLREWDGMLSSHARQWLAEKLSESEKNGEIAVLLTHVPIWSEASDGIAAMWDARELLGILDGFKQLKACFAGHYHPGGCAARKGVLHKTVKALCNAASPTAVIARVFPDRIELEPIGEEIPCVHPFQPGPCVLEGRALPGCYVMTSSGEIVRADRDGRFSITVPFPGRYALRAVADGYADGVLPMVEAPAESLQFSMRPEPGRRVVHGFTGDRRPATLRITDDGQPVPWFDLAGTPFGSLEKPGFWYEKNQSFWTRGEYAFSVRGAVSVTETPHHPELRKRGWFKGDFHAHLAHGENFYRGNVILSAFLARAEHYDWLYLAEQYGNDGGVSDPFAAAEAASGPNLLLKLNREFPKNCNGHIALVGEEPFGGQVREETVPNLEVCRRSLTKGIAVPVHPFYDDSAKTGGIGRMYDKELFLRLLCAPEEFPCLDVYYHNDTPGATACYRMLLDRGYRIGATATSDAAFDVGRTPGDRGATFVRMTELSEPALLAGLRERRTAVSWNGAVLLLEVDGRSSGDVLPAPFSGICRAEIFFRPGEKLRLHLWGRKTELHTVPVVCDGLGRGAVNLPLRIEKSGYVFGTLTAPDDADRIFAAASPVYFREKTFREPEILPYPNPFPRELHDFLRERTLAETMSETLFDEVAARLKRCFF